jgi:hypothetical protein
MNRRSHPALSGVPLRNSISSRCTLARCCRKPFEVMRLYVTENWPLNGNFSEPQGGVGMTIYRYSVVNTPESSRTERNTPPSVAEKGQLRSTNPFGSRNTTSIWKPPRTFPSEHYGPIEESRLGTVHSVTLTERRADSHAVPRQRLAGGTFFNVVCGQQSMHVEFSTVHRIS